jgi:hypothetical protein
MIMEKIANDGIGKNKIENGATSVTLSHGGSLRVKPLTRSETARLMAAAGLKQDEIGTHLLFAQLCDRAAITSVQEPHPVHPVTGSPVKPSWQDVGGVRLLNQDYYDALQEQDIDAITKARGAGEVTNEEKKS